MPLLSDYAVASLVRQSADNFPHTCEVQSTADGRVWTTIPGAAHEPCRLSKPSPSAVRARGGVAISAASAWILALRAGSPYAAARLRFIVTGSDHGTAFTKTLYSIGALTPIAQTADARVECTEDPLAVLES